MRNDYWEEYEDDFPYETMADADYFNASIDGYEPGDAYQLGNFATAQWLGSQSLTNGSVLLDEFAGGNYSADENYCCLRYGNR